MCNNLVGPKICSTKRALVREFDSVKIILLNDSNVHSINDIYSLEYLILANVLFPLFQRPMAQRCSHYQFDSVKLQY